MGGRMLCDCSGKVSGFIAQRLCPHIVGDEDNHCGPTTAAPGRDPGPPGRRRPERWHGGRTLGPRRATGAAANAFLPGFLERFNARFARPAADPTPAWVPLPTACDLAYHFAVRETRTVRAAEHCVQWQGRLLEVERAPGPAAGGR